MNTPKFGFHFEEAGRSPDDGAVDPQEEHFRGSTADGGDPALAAVREMGQNSLDARRGDHDEPVRMEFELAMMRTEVVPGIDGLRIHLEQAIDATRDQEGNDRLQAALEMASRPAIPVLRVSDFGTTGLTGSERLDSPNSPLSRLTRGSGNSANDGHRGGSFGIGSAAGRVASALRTVLYRSRPHDDDRTVFAGFSRLATHNDAQGVRVRAGGIFTRIDSEDFEYLRPAPELEPFPERTEPGTDIFVLGYQLAESDPQLHKVRDAALENFLVAIDRGRLEFTGVAGNRSWRLSAENLEEQVRRISRAAAFYQALRDPNPGNAVLPSLGEVTLHVNMDDRLERSLHTITMRKPLMRIAEYTFRSVRAKYAAIAICENDEGNRLLRSLEPPQHDRWDPTRSPEHGPAAIDELKTFIRDELRARVSENLGDTVEIRGLAQYIPSIGLEQAGLAEVGRPDGTQPPSEVESSQVTGSTETPDVRIKGRPAVQIPVIRPAIGRGDQLIRRGKLGGGPGRRRSGGGDLTGAGDAGDGSSRIRSGDLTFRSWSAGEAADGQRTILRLCSESDISGDLELVAVGASGQVDRDHDLRLQSVRRVDGDSTVMLQHHGNTVKGLVLRAGEGVRLEVITPRNIRYRLGVA